MQTTTLSYANLHNHGALFANVFRARKQSFIERKEWDLPEVDGMEYDQYDTPASRWIVAHEGEMVLGGMRFTPTTHRCGVYSYMIRDAQLGVIDTIPNNLLHDKAPVDPDIWEGSRMFVNNATPMKIRRRLHAVLTLATLETAHSLGVKRVLGIIPATWPRWAPRIGCDLDAAGPVMDIDGEENQCISMDMSRNTEFRGFMPTLAAS